MATKLNQTLINQLAKIGITATTEEDARKKLLVFLKKNDVEGVDEDEIKSLIEMAEVFYEPTGNEEEEAADEEEEEAPAPTKKAAPKAPVKTAPAPAKKPTPAPTKKAAPVVEEEEEEIEEVVKEVKNKNVVTKKPNTAPAAKPTGVGRKTELTGDKWDGRNNKVHLAMIAGFKKLFPEKDFQIDLLKQGFTVRVLGKNAKTTIMNFDEIRVDGKVLIGNFYCNRFKSADDLYTVLPEAYQEPEKTVGMFRGESHPCVRKVTAEELMDIINNSEFLTESLNRANATDVKMGKNREKLENAMTNKPAAKTPAPAAKAPVKAKPEPVVEEEEELEEEEEELEEEAAGDQFDEMDRTALKACIKENNLDIKVYKTTTDEDLRDSVRIAMNQLEEE